MIGRFVTADSIIPDWYNPQAFDPYTYTLNNPLAYIDPTGHAPKIELGVDKEHNAQIKEKGFVEGTTDWYEGLPEEQKEKNKPIKEVAETQKNIKKIKDTHDAFVQGLILERFGGLPSGMGGAIKGKPPTPKKTPKITKDVKVRKEPGADNATSSHIREKLGDETISVTHQVKDQSGKTIHQHQTHIGKHGTQRRFSDEWVEYPTVRE